MSRREQRAQWIARHRQEASNGASDGRQPGGQVYDAPQPQAISLHIDELVLHGFAPADRYRIGDAVQRELTRLFVEGGVPPQLGRSGEVERIDAGSFQMAGGAKSESVGAKIANAVYGGPKR